MQLIRRLTNTRPLLNIVEGPRNGPSLVMLHGVTRRAEDFRVLWDGLSSRFHLLALDQRGHGDSERANGYLVTDYVADVVALLRAELPQPVVLFGHSLGAMVAAAVAAELPNRVRGIVLEDPPFHTMGRNIHGTTWQAQFSGMQQAALRGGSVEQLTDALAEIQIPQQGGSQKSLGELRDRPSLTWSAECLARLDPQVLTPIIEGRWLDGYDFPTMLSDIRCPALLLQADPSAGGALTDADAGICQDMIAKCSVVKFPRCGHLLHGHEPARIAKLVNEMKW